MKTLIFCEKPSQAREYVSAIEKRDNKKFKKENGYFESTEYIVTYAVGHMLRSVQMGDYDDFGGWAWEAIPYYPKNSKLNFIPNEHMEVQLNIVKKQFQRNDVGLILNGADAGREGELIFWEVYHYTECELPVKRLWLSQLLEKEIIKALANLKEEEFFLPRKDAAYSRQYADWLLGMNLTVGFTIKANMGRTLHIGRVQTPTISILANRRKEIEEFVAKDYYEIEADFGGKYKGKWYKDELSKTTFEKFEDAQAIVDKINNKTAKVVQKNVKEDNQNPKTLFNLSDLQAESNRKFGYTAAKVLDVAQVLYEKYKYTTYPRTSSKHLGQSYIQELEPTLKAIRVKEYEKYVDEILQNGIKTSKLFIDDSKLSDHHAIVPTEMTPKMDIFQDEVKNGKVIATKEELKNVYDLIVRRFLAVFYPAAKYEVTSIVTEVESETFKTNGKILVDMGWKVVFGKDEEEEEEVEANSKKRKEEKVKIQTLPPIDLDEEQIVVNGDLQSKKTNPPKHFTDAKLIEIMEDPRKLLDDEELKQVLKESKAGLATEATRSGIIENIIFRGYVERKGKNLVATDLAMKLVEVAPENLKSPMVTALWEEKLIDMAEEKITQKDFNEEIELYVKEVLDDLKKTNLSVDFGHVTDGEHVGICPTCKGEVKDSRGRYKCTTPNCFELYKKVASKEISVAQVKQLLKNGQTAMLKGFKTKEGKSFTARLEIKGGKVNLTTSEELDIKCPKCEAQLLATDKVVKCPNEDSHLLIFTTMAKKKLSIKDVKAVFEKGESPLIKGFESSKGTKFDAKLKFNSETGRLDFKFEEKPKAEIKETDMKCPLCEGKIRETEKSFSCENWKEKSCKFTAWKVMNGRPMSQTDYKDILENDMKSSKKLEGFISKAGKPFGTFIKFNKETVRFEFDFEQK